MSSALGVALFHTTSAALRAEKTLLKSGLAVNRDDEAKEYLRKMRKHHPRSPLLGALGEK